MHTYNMHKSTYLCLLSLFLAQQGTAVKLLDMTNIVILPLQVVTCGLYVFETSVV